MGVEVHLDKILADRGRTLTDVANEIGITLANLSILALSGEDIIIRVIDDLFEVTRVDSRAVIDAPVGTVVSLVPIGVCTGVTTSGLRWELDDRDIAFGPLGVHNEVVQRPAAVSLREGLLLLFRGRFVEKHQ